MYLPITSLSESEILQHDVINLEDRENVWDMNFHPSKCQVIHVTRVKSEGNHPLAMLRSHAFYGFTACYYNFWAKGLHETVRLPTGSVRCTCQHRTKLCGYCTGLGIPVRSVVLDHTGPYGARNGSIAPNSPAGPVATDTVVSG